MLYHDHETHDGRLALSALRAAADAGAVVLPHAEVVRLVAEGGRVRGAELTDRLGGRRLRIEARAVVNATGPWVDAVRRLEDAGAGPSVRLSKGVHLVLEGGRDWSAAVTTPLPGGRVSFAIPWEGMLLLGTTDEPYDGDPGAVGQPTPTSARSSPRRHSRSTPRCSTPAASAPGWRACGCCRWCPARPAEPAGRRSSPGGHRG